MANDQIDEIYKDLNDFKQIPHASDYLISKYGLVYNINTQKYRKPMRHKNTKLYIINLNIQPRQQQIKNLLYVTYMDPDFDVDELVTESKYCIKIKNTRDDQPFINFTIEDLELTSKSNILKGQARHNRIINKYDLDKNFIRSYDNVEEAKIDLKVNDGKYITLCASKSLKQPKYKNFIFRYDNIDEIKYPNLVDKEDRKLTVDEFNAKLNLQDNNEEEIWKTLTEYTSSNTVNPITYEISNFGNFRSKKKIINVKSKQYGKYKINTPTQNIVSGYKYCNLTTDNRTTLKFRTNVLVAKYFLTIPERLKNLPTNKIVVDHIDHNKLNNHYTNLQYVTYNENNSREYRD